ncbi:hypothetical protein N0002_24295 [Pseudomonas aeruginosa]|uniref:Bacterial toxin YdaT domain-containing protein n=2 Tax=Pseudomonas aeruginosa TaxID=287 RepID=A0A5E5RAV4_PSEAI|nr:hypothetical protein [Pseudomonas aeruginosa]EKX3960159.1 hypothetical protein [Pseudomonas aeruginosa]ELS0915578.1 hypothetical protein [Pseudomonas aeruginosa]ERW04933.1 hypothetical protein Q037_02308 [Pseudomonas aeruginosa BWHPSA024]ERW85289.1 hypothetical protein Q018_02616 [Pseudomonas aeruginosa BWHPSA005]EZN50556.1 hypothetical protein AJ76_00922 [Pseudomonas aeruginosa BWH036]
MRTESHTLISTLLGVVNQWRRREGWSRETVVQHIVEAHERIQGALVTGIIFDPPTRDTTERMKVNADRVFRWLDDGTKDTNLVPANFVPSILAALPTDLKVQALGDILTPLGVSVRLIGGDAGQRPEVLCMLRTLIKENGEAQQAVANLVDGADDQELQEAHRELSESRAATDEALRMIDQMRRPRLVQG